MQRRRVDGVRPSTALHEIGFLATWCSADEWVAAYVECMRIGQVILRVSDLERSTVFWSETFGLAVSMSGGAFAFLDGGGVSLVLNRVDQLPEDSSLTEIVFEFDDVRASHSELAERGVPFEVELRPVTADGERELWAAHFRDPDGHLASVTGWVRSG
jgi:catechol 2,3-dioxygenase-like lactoylglutathione lyase family enzyme